MMANAARESGFDADVRASTSSATGLYQFIDQTWLGMVKTHGAEQGHAQYAHKISGAGDGSYTTKDHALPREILGYRPDPPTNTPMPGETPTTKQTTHHT